MSPALPCLRFVLDDDVTDATLETGLREAAKTLGRALSGPADADESARYRCRTWNLRPGEAHAQRIADDAIDTRWLSLCAPLHELGPLQAALSEHVPWRTRGTLVAAARQGKGADVIRLALATNALEDEEVESVLGDALRHADADVRAAAAEAIYLLHWPQLLPAIERALATEADTGVRSMLEEIRKRDGGA